MEPSQMNLSAAVIVLLLVMAADMGTVQAGECFTQSSTFKGMCIGSDRCAAVCMDESPAYSGGKCRGIFFHCFCITPCATSTA